MTCVVVKFDESDGPTSGDPSKSNKKSLLPSCLGKNLESVHFCPLLLILILQNAGKRRYFPLILVLSAAEPHSQKSKGVRWRFLTLRHEI